MNDLCIAISNYKSWIKVIFIEYIQDDIGKQTKVLYIKNHKANDNTVMLAGWLSLEEVRDYLYEFLDRDPIEI